MLAKSCAVFLWPLSATVGATVGAVITDVLFVNSLTTLSPYSFSSLSQATIRSSGSLVSGVIGATSRIPSEDTIIVGAAVTGAAVTGAAVTGAAVESGAAVTGTSRCILPVGTGITGSGRG